MKTKDIINLNNFLKEVQGAKIPFGLAVKIAGILEKYDSVARLYDERRKELFEKLGETDDKGNSRIKEENIDEFANEMNSILETDVEYELPELKTSEFESISIEPATLLPIIKYLK